MKEEILKTSIGFLKLVSEKDEILKLEFVWNRKLEGTSIKTTFAKDVEKQIEEYLLGKRKWFDLKISPSLGGTAFQKRVWNIVSKIPFGKTLTYQDVAKKVGNKNLARAVGQALKLNRIVILIPCHRVVSKSGIGGFSGKNHLDVKRKLLKMEGISCYK